MKTTASNPLSHTARELNRMTVFYLMLKSGANTQELRISEKDTIALSDPENIHAELSVRGSHFRASAFGCLSPMIPAYVPYTRIAESIVQKIKNGSPERPSLHFRPVIFFPSFHSSEKALDISFLFKDKKREFLRYETPRSIRDMTIRRYDRLPVITSGILQSTRRASVVGLAQSVPSISAMSIAGIDKETAHRMSSLGLLDFIHAADVDMADTGNCAIAGSLIFEFAAPNSAKDPSYIVECLSENLGIKLDGHTVPYANLRFSSRFICASSECVYVIFRKPDTYCIVAPFIECSRADAEDFTRASYERICVDLLPILGETIPLFSSTPYIYPSLAWKKGNMFSFKLLKNSLGSRVKPSQKKLFEQTLNWICEM